MKIAATLILGIIATIAGVDALVVQQPAGTKNQAPAITNDVAGRRHFLLSATAAVKAAAIVGATAAVSPQPASAAVKGNAPQGSFILGKIDKKSTVGKEISSFDSLIENFKNTRLDGGLDASKLKEPSISFLEFGAKLKEGKVTFVEFLAPNGDIAYASVNTGEGGKNERLRIGQGYPTTSKSSWSSPDYVIRAVSNYGVPYAFTVPALAKFKTRKA